MLSRLKFLADVTSDHKIIEGLTQGGSARRIAEDALFNRFSYYIKEGTKKYSLNEEESFDAYCDAVIATISAIVFGKFEERASIKTFVYRIYNNKCVDLIRKKTTNKESIHRVSADPEILMQLSDNSKTIIQQLVEKVDAEELKRKIERLGENCRRLLTMFADGYSDKQIAAEMLYNSADVVKTSRLRCLQKLKHAYAL